MAINQTPPQPIAIVGSSCRFPGQSTSPSKLYELLRQPKDVRRDFDPEILNLQRFYDENPDAPGSTNVKPKGYLLSDDTRTFDASFFNISPYEAESMDPQLRVMLETVYEAFESAGYTLDQMRGSKTSVHVGVMTSDYYDILTRDPETVPLYAGTGVTRSILSNRISYTFDLHGPSVTLDTACSSSLVALHQAVQGLQTGDATCAVVCGVNLIFDPMLYVMLSKLHMLSPDSQSRMWDKTVNGYARGEGAGCVVLKPLGQALRDGDTIEGIIRGSGVNSDGQSMGLTMPTVEAQATLIRDVYQRAGLDPIKDRCQYFECHGTGTPVGDPVESRAIYEAMIQGGETSGFKPKDPLYVGSIKTIIGHLEGGAGLAGVMKALLSIKHKTIFPNLLFDELNPAIKPYYDGFKVPTSPTPWPELPDGTPLRVSVNSFGFGGTNAHAIIESYEPKDGSETHLGAQDLEEPLGPFVLSANIATSLIGNAKSLLRYLNEKPSVDLTDLSWALQNKRGAHRVRTFFTAQSREALIESLEKFITQHRKSTGKDEIGIRARPADPQKKPRTIGIFTGQGAQWPTMGRGLLSSSPTFRRVIEQCDKILSALPDGPEWSLMEELSKDADTSRVAEAVISQPICTAVQLGLVEILRESGVHLDTVVGHSSGEITAAYICGIIDAAAALQIAYYRGKCAHQACGADGQPGGMLAVGIDFDVADAFCKQPQYQGRLGVAASNAPKSVTLSGDLDAVKEAKTHFDQDGIFARQLQVDTAYHSHHMDRCAETYLKSLATCNISVHPPKDDCSWVSSVRGDSALSEDDLDSVKGPYWVKNMVQTVLFCPAIQSAVQIGGNFDLSIEIGPNPTLRGPTQQTLELAQGAAPPHIGTLKRNANDVESLGETMGTIWCHLGVAHVNFDGFRRTFASSKPKTIKLLKDLPVYAWDHDRVYWSESRISKNYRKRDDMRHPLLGRRVSDDTDQIMRWRNVLKIADLPWTQGHVVSGEVLLPGTSYIAMACDAASYIAGLSIIRRIEIEDVKIRRAVIVPDSREGVETTFTMRLEESKGSDRIAGDFSYHFSDNGSMVHAGNGKIVAYLGAPSEHELPPFQPTGLTLYPIDSDTSYETIAQNGFLYTGPFRRLEGIQRKLDYAVAEAEWSLDEVSGDYTLHPAIMDVSWQNLFTASADPRAGQLPTLILPVGIKRVTINPNLILNTQGTIKTRNEAFITTRDGAAIAGDVHIYDVASGNAVVQMESVILEPIAPPSEEQDRKMFFDTIYKEDPMLRLVEPVYDPEECQRVQELSSDIERVCLVYVQHVLRELKPDERPGLEWFHKRLITAFENYVESTREDRHPVAQKAWLTDSPSILEAIYAKWPGVVDLEVVRVCGENMLDTLRKKTSLLELMMEGDLSTRLYSDGCGLAQANHGMTHVLEQISHKFPLARYVEIGAGTGSTTNTILSTIGNSFESYTFTDISPAFFGDGATRFSDFRSKMVFKTLDAEKDVTPQGFEKHAYDVVVASNVLHATAQLTKTLENARSLLKPGGFLFLIEITGIEIIRTTFCVGGLPGWWLGADEGRDLHPGMSTEQWDSKLQDTGFSGVDLVFHDIPDAKQHTMSFIASQAVDDTVQLLREPLECLAEGPELKSLVVVGGKTLPISKAVNALKRLLGPAYSSRITIASDVESIDFSRAGNRADFICLQELDGSLFAKEITPKTLKALQTMIVGARNVLWVTTGRRTKNPYANMMVGMARAISKELPHVKMQFLDLDTTSSPTSVARTTLETFLRMHILASHDHEASPLLWPQEPELLVEGSDTLIPRLRPDKLLNDRYNAKFRVISKSVNSSDTPISFTRQREKLALTESVPQPHAQSSEASSVRVQYSLFVPGEKEESICFSIGRLVSSNAFVIAVSAKQASIISVPEENVASIDEMNCNPVYLQRMVNQIAMAGLFSLIENGGSALLHNPTESLAAAFVAQARKHDVQPLCASSNTVVPQGWMKIHPQSPARVLRYLLPQDINIYLDASTSPDMRSSSITSALPRSCKLCQWDSSLVQRGLLSASSIKEAIRAACSNLSEHSTTAHCDTRVLNIEDIATTEASILNRTHIVNWVSARPLKLIVQPPDTTVLFDSAKTHLMIGMAGGLGLSVCGWALQHGIKEMVITSRMPNINAEWLLQARNQGARVHVRSLDASDRPALDSLISNIRETLPPLGGVCNAAMVLSDKLFVDLDVDAITETFKPKVNVSRYLNEILADVPLDYFVMFSSALSQIGGQGSSNYHAANLYMAGLAAQRRQNGRPGSVIHIGYVTDVGYFMRVDQSSRDYIGRMQIVPLSETDVHHAFAEALRAGRPGSERSCEVGLGIEPLDAMIEDQEPVWAADPLFAHFLPSTNSHDKTDGAQFGRDDIKKLIQEAETDAEVVDIVQEALCAKIETMLQLPTGSVDADALLTELGIDSLVAVEIRAWFSKKVGIDVPVVKILGRSSLLQICQDATEEVNATKVKETPKTAESEPGSSSDSQNMSDSSDAEGPSSGTVSPPPSTEGESIELGDEKLEMVRTTAQEEQRSDSKAVVELAEPTPDFYQSLINSGRMSAAQSRIYVLNYLMNDPTAYSLMIRYDIEDNLDIDRLKNALTTTMQHHEALRTCYFAHEDLDQPTQGLLSFPVRRFKHVPNATDKDIDEELNAIRTKVWDIEHGETMSLTVLSRDARTHILILGYHHIILDASGMRRFIEDLNFAYNRRTLKMLGKTCIDFAAREQEGLRSGALDKNFQYWREQFTPLPELLPLLPMAKTTVRPETKQIVSVHASREIDEDAVIKVKQMCQVLGVTAFQFHLAVVQVLLAQLLGLDDLCIGVADANRPDTDFMDTVGFFLNLLPVRFHLPADTTFAQVAQNTARQMGAAFENSVPFDMLLDQLNIARSATHTPLFQVLVNYRLAMTQSIPFGNSHLHIVDGEEGRNPYDITFSFLESHTKGLGITMDCMDSLYDVAGIESILDMYIDLLTSILRDIHLPVSDCQVYSAEAVSAALELGSGDYKETSGPATLAEKFQLVQQSFKDRVAIQDRSSELKYHELATRVNFIAATILDADQKAGSRVAVLCEPSVDFIASLLAILHIGAIYVPLDVSLPSSRHAEIISSSDPSLIICHQATRESATQLVGENMANLHILELDNIKSMYEAVPCSADADSPAFLLFTSGTTGKPKGVTLSQGNVINWLAHAIPADKFDVTQTSVLQQSSFGFDMSLLQSFCALMSGGRLVIVPQDIRKDPPQIAKLIYEKNVNWTFGVPSEYLLWLRYGREYLRQCKGWRIARIGGEFFPVQLKREIKRLELPNLSISDNYGPTEITFTVTSRPVSLEIEKTIASGSNIGKAHHNYAICILDASGRPVPQGFRGEICIGGPGIAQGYWNMPVETDKKFIADPTAGIGNRKATTNRWYRTGDQGKLAPDGSVIFIGRLGGDTQVKLRGQRIELAEIEGALLNAGDALLSTAVVTVRDGDLIAHVIPNRGKLVDREVIQSKMMTGLNLPQYMHPARVIVVEDLPRSNTGKIDRQAVLKLSLVTSHDDDDEDGASDLTLREHELKVLWSRVLPDPYQKLTAESDFFLEGGNSLRLTKLQNEIKETLGIFVSARELYGTPTLRQMAARIGADTVSDDDVDWSVEIAIPEDLMAAAREVPKIARTPKTKDLEILLTGAAGVLGNYILHHLLEDPAVAKVHCIAIATEDEERIPTSDKVHTYFGSLASNELGLNESELETLKSSIDVVIHAGANGHCLNSYGSIRKPNVESTQFLASLCLPRSVPFLYLSSQRVPAMAGLKTLPPVPVLAEPAKTGDTGYMASRWVSERFLHKFSEHNNFLTEIHRPCLFFGDRAPPSDALNGVLRYTRLMRAVPHFAKVEGYVDIKEADDIARDIVASAIAMAGSSSTGVHFRHHSSGRKVTMEEWPGYMGELTGETFEVLELPDWIARARKAGIHPLIATYLEGVVEKEELGLFPYLGEELEEE